MVVVKEGEEEQGATAKLSATRLALSVTTPAKNIIPPKFLSYHTHKHTHLYIQFSSPPPLPLLLLAPSTPHLHKLGFTSSAVAS